MRGGIAMLKVDSWPSFAWSFLIVKLFHFLQYRILVELASDCMTRWTRHLNVWPTWIKENCVQHIFLTLMVLLAIYGHFWSFLFHCLLSNNNNNNNNRLYFNRVTHLATTNLAWGPHLLQICTYTEIHKDMHLNLKLLKKNKKKKTKKLVPVFHTWSYIPQTFDKQM